MKKRVIVILAAVVIVPLAGAGLMNQPGDTTVSRDARVFGDCGLRRSPENDAEVLRVIPANSLVVMAGKQTDPNNLGLDDTFQPNQGLWLPVVVDGQVGYIPTKYAEGPWLNQRRAGDTRIEPVDPEIRAKIIRMNL